MNINNEIITKPKLKEFEKILTLETWEEVASKTDSSILGEMDWYLIDGLMGDYLMVTQLKESKQHAPDLEHTLKEHCDESSTIEYFKKIASQLELENK